MRPCGPEALDATNDSEGARCRKVLGMQKGSPDATQLECRIVGVLMSNRLSSDTSQVNNSAFEDFE